MTIDLPTLIRESHATAVEKGWWPEGETRDLDEQFANFHAEVSEAWEEYRSGRPLERIWFDWPEEYKAHTVPEGQPSKSSYCPSCMAAAVERNPLGACPECDAGVNPDLPSCHRCGYLTKPEGFTVELADLLIRIADTMGGHNNSVVVEHDVSAEHSVQEFICLLHKRIARTSRTGELSEIVRYVECFCTSHNLPLEEAIRLKMAYNKTRPMRHGGKLA